MFDFLQKFRPLWHEEAGPEALISRQVLLDGFAGTGVTLESSTSVFVPSHLINLLPRNLGKWVLRATDMVARTVPGLRTNGGLILLRGTRDGPKR